MSFDGANVLITGGTGSFGKQCIKGLLAKHKPAKVIVYSRDELKQHEMLTGGFDAEPMRYFIGDVRDADRLRRATRGVDVVIHAAALKQVPACEYNPIEAIETNVTGTRNVIDACLDNNVSKAIAISTDKAVHPVNLYGATKLCAEKLFVQGNSYAGRDGTKFSCVRYGNVIGSRGSVIPLFLKQRETGRITVTDKRMTRFWITLEEVIDFVLDNAQKMVGGEVFVPKLASMRLTDLADAIAPDCQVEEIGIRPGEKIHEALVSEDEARTTIELEDRYIIQPVHPWWGARPAPAGTPMPEGTSYTSDCNDRWLTVDDLRAFASNV